ncbi:hypothetical protein SAMN04487928_104140 [Butyrivibrio proteoclasticus]|uniref:Uncharacterized protein n=1 Tax=Butyrivibrio proteoclasticus TaxID=43305 RepID=A0A1I5RQB5_9FIRM|nr:DUF5688 family protein [Butyrivibrio proteoclasticus]SFP60744.1 hypothetical protein SAMN04487928_104140 [Butyrivibrio proteoclasticus]
MNILEFGRIMTEEVKDALGNAVDVEFKEITKNNGVVNHALIIRKQTENVAPTIYIDNLYDKFMDGMITMSIVNEIVEMYNQYAPGKNIDVSFFTDFSKVAGLLAFKVVNYYKNEEILRDIPHKKFADLAMVPFCLVQDEIFGRGLITIKNEHLSEWEVSADELWENVYENAPKILPLSFCNMDEYVPALREMQTAGTLPEMFVLSNSSKINGAGAFLYPGAMEAISKALKSNLIIIPSSVHEVIVLPSEKMVVDPHYLYKMVKEVNCTVVEDGEVLSDNVYYYDKNTGKMGILQEEMAI